MTTEQLTELFEKHADEMDHCWKNVKNKRSTRADLHAFLLLDSLLPGNHTAYGKSIVGSAEHDEIWLNFDLDELAKVLTEEHIIELVCCGVTWDSHADGLHLFV